MAYCDDILLLSPTVAHMKRLLQSSQEYAVDWKIEFNPSKSLALSNRGGIKPEFHINSSIILLEKNFLYLALPIGDENYIVDYFNDKMNIVERSLYSLGRNLSSNRNEIKSNDEPMTEEIRRASRHTFPWKKPEFKQRYYYE